MTTAGELLAKVFPKRDGLDRLLAGEELDARIMRGLAELASERSNDARIFDWLDSLSRAEVKALRADLIERLRERDEAAVARQEADDPPAPVFNRQVIDRRPLELKIMPGGALVERFAGDDEREAQRAQSLAARRAAEFEDRAADAQRMRDTQEALNQLHNRELPPHLRQ